jgi:competence protein ComEA
MKLHSQIVKDYFTFSKKERLGIFVLLFLSAFVFLIFRFLPARKTQVSKDTFQKELLQLKISIDTAHGAYVYQNNNDAENYRPKHYNNYNNPAGELFVFDPNTLDENGWKRLGVRDKTVQTIQNFVGKGYRFREPDDIRKIYGLRSQEADRLVPFVRIAKKEGSNKKSVEPDSYKTNNHDHYESIRTKIIDINLADTSEFIALPGIGSKLAARIINFRQKLGGFSSVSQLGETYGIADSTFQKIKVRLQCDNPDVKKLNINMADANELKTHPYIKWNIANAIVNYRKQHGTYKSIDELHKIEIIDDEIYTKIAPYLALQ